MKQLLELLNRLAVKCATLSICIFLFTNHITNAQGDTTSRQSHFSFKTNLFQFFLTGEVRLLTEKFLNKNNSAELLSGYYVNYNFYDFFYTGRSPEYLSFQRGFKTGIGFRHYFDSRFLLAEDWEIYLNPVFFYKQMAYTNKRDFDLFPSGERWEHYNYDSHVYSFQVHSGLLYEFNKIILDGYVGLGVRYIHNIGISVLRLDSYGTPYPTGSPFISKGFLPTLHFGINLGFGKL